MTQPRLPDGDSLTSMPAIGIPSHRNRVDTGVVSRSGSSEHRIQTPRTTEELLDAVEVARIE